MSILSFLAAVGVIFTLLVLYILLMRASRQRAMNKIMAEDSQEPQVCLASSAEEPLVVLDVWVIPYVHESSPGSSWAVRSNGDLVPFRTQKEAESHGRNLAKAYGSELIIVGRNGEIRKRTVYDPPKTSFTPKELEVISNSES
jgi:hypothetical protein